MNTFFSKKQELEAPAFITFLFNDTRASILWLALRVWLGWQWIESGLPKLSNPAWMESGEAILGFWTRAVAIPEEGRPPIAYAWYRGVIQFMIDAGWHTWFAKLVAVSEVVFGVLLIAGVFVGFVAALAGFLNWNFVMAGSASVNGMFILISFLLIVAWKISGYIGIDYWLLPRLAKMWMPAKTKK